jgi:aurora kinase
LHEKNIVHRDIKPENIMLSNVYFIFNIQEIIKLGDFGYSVFIDPNLGRKTLCGTIEYVSPEMAKGLKYDSKIDSWSLGILTYETMFGKAPFVDKNDEKVFQKIKFVNWFFKSKNKYEIPR